MIQAGTKLNVADNTGAKQLECISVLCHKKDHKAAIGDIITASVKLAIPRGVVKKKDVVKAVIVRSKKELKRSDGSIIRFDDNAAVIVNDDKTPKATRVFGPVPRELRDLGYAKIISLAPEVL